MSWTNLIGALENSQRSTATKQTLCQKKKKKNTFKMVENPVLFFLVYALALAHGLALEEPAV